MLDWLSFDCNNLQMNCHIQTLINLSKLKNTFVQSALNIIVTFFPQKNHFISYLKMTDVD